MCLAMNSDYRLDFLFFFSPVRDYATAIKDEYFKSFYEHLQDVSIVLEGFVLKAEKRRK